MSDAQEAGGPPGDGGRHLSTQQLEAGLSGLAPPPAETGRVRLIACRRRDGLRATPEKVVLSPEEGVPGDRWGRQRDRQREEQLSVMRRDLAELIANGQPLTTFGDNLFVDLDLSTANLPPGTRLQIGRAVVEVSPEPHEGCLKFKARFGQDALRFVSGKDSRGLNRRGVYWMVVEAGEVAVGDEIRVLSRPPPAVT